MVYQPVFILHTVIMPGMFEGNLPTGWHGEFLWPFDVLDFHGTLYCMVVKCQVLYSRQHDPQTCSYHRMKLCMQY